MVKTRRFSLDEDFMKYDTDDLVYGYMRCLTTIKPEDGKYKEYLTIKNLQPEKKVIQNICGTTARTINNRINKLIEKGLIQKGLITIDKEEYECYYFPYNYDGVYKILEQDMIRYLVNTRNSQAIRIYLYLLNCSTIKPNYVFTIKEIKKALGYAETTKTADKVIGDVLESFQKEGIIKLSYEWFECTTQNGSINKTERMVLNFIASKREQF